MSGFVSDALSAMLQDRPYRKAISFDIAHQVILNCSGTQFDPVEVKAFGQSIGSIKYLLEALAQTEITV